MAIYALWNNKGGVGKSYLTFQIACEYARTHATQKVLVVDLCPQANSSTMLLGGMEAGERTLDELCRRTPSPTIVGYIDSRSLSPYQSPSNGANYAIRVNDYNREIPNNLYLVTGNEELEVRASRVANACNPGPTEAWRIVHLWIKDR